MNPILRYLRILNSMPEGKAKEDYKREFVKLWKAAACRLGKGRL